MTQTAAVPTSQQAAEAARASRSADLGTLPGWTDDRSNGSKEDGTLFQYVCHVDMSSFTAADAAVCIRDYLGRKINDMVRKDDVLRAETRQSKRLDITAAELMSGKRSRTIVVMRNVTAEEVIADMAAKGVPLTAEQAAAMAAIINSKK